MAIVTKNLVIKNQGVKNLTIKYNNVQVDGAITTYNSLQQNNVETNPMANSIVEEAEVSNFENNYAESKSKKIILNTMEVGNE